MDVLLALLGWAAISVMAVFAIYVGVTNKYPWE